MHHRPTSRSPWLNDSDEYPVRNVFVVPEEARWSRIVEMARQGDIKLRLHNVLEALAPPAVGDLQNKRQIRKLAAMRTSFCPSSCPENPRVWLKETQNQ